MASREARFRQAALAYLGYGILYLAGAAYLAAHGIGARGTGSTRGGLAWFLLGLVLVAVVPWLVARGHRGAGYLWFTRILTVLVAVRAVGVGQVAWHPTVSSVPLPGGYALPMAVGAWAFFLVTLATLAMLARAAWNPRP